MNEALKQLMKFGIVGVVSFGIDYGLMILLTEMEGFHYLLSSGISFGVSVVVNYLLSMRFVFKRRKDGSRAEEFAVFTLLSLSGLALTEALMWLVVEKANITYMLSKIFVTGIVMIYNFITRKVFLEEKMSSRK